MTTIAIVTGLASCLMLLIASYLFGYSRGSENRQDLQQTIRRLENDLAFVTERSSRHAPEDESRLSSTIQQVLAPLIERERQSRDLARIHLGTGNRRDLSPLLDRIASVGNFSTVLLANDDGLLLGSSFTSDDVDSMAAESSRIMLVADQSAREQGATALSVMVHYAPDMVILCRMFEVQGQRLSLTAVANDPRLTPVALDPALATIETALSAASKSRLQIAADEVPVR